MKTGILTFHSAYNFGASLQAWALQTKLEELGVDAEVGGVAAVELVKRHLHI